jgi:hypothetical protein
LGISRENSVLEFNLVDEEMVHEFDVVCGDVLYLL